MDAYYSLDKLGEFSRAYHEDRNGQVDSGWCDVEVVRQLIDSRIVHIS